jgi:hypothetical protein
VHGASLSGDSDRVTHAAASVNPALTLTRA